MLYTRVAKHEGCLWQYRKEMPPIRGLYHGRVVTVTLRVFRLWTTWEAEAEGLQVWRQPGLQNKFKPSLDSTARPYIKHIRAYAYCRLRQHSEDRNWNRNKLAEQDILTLTEILGVLSFKWWLGDSLKVYSFLLGFRHHKTQLLGQPGSKMG